MEYRVPQYQKQVEVRSFVSFDKLYVARQSVKEGRAGSNPHEYSGLMVHSRRHPNRPQPRCD